MRNLSIVFLLLALAAPLHAQARTEPCIAVTANGDTLRGKVQYENWDQNPTSIWFSNQEDAYKSYQPVDLQSFRVGDDMYIGAEVDVEKSSRESESLSFKTKLRLVRKTVFLKVLVMGPKCLLHYKDASSNDFFYIRTDSTIKLLEYKRVYDYVDGKTSVREIKKYVGQLSLYLNDRPDLQGVINKVDYTQSSMIALFEKYYKDLGTVSILESSKQKVKVNFGMYAGPTINSILFSGSSFPEFTYGLAMTKPTLTTGLYFEISEPRNFGRWSFYNDIQYDAYNFSSKYSTNTYTVRSILNLDFLKWNTMLRYKILVGNFSVYVAGGAFVAFLVNQTNSQTVESINTGTTLSSGEALEGVSHTFSNYVLSTGLLYKKWTIEARIGEGGCISPYTYLRMDAVNCCILLGYRF